MSKFWHTYGAVIPDAGAHATMVIGPTNDGPDALTTNGTPFRDFEIPLYGARLKYLTSFDHEPSALEKDRLAPEEYRELDDEGHILEPAIDVTRRSPEGIEVTTRHSLRDL